MRRTATMLPALFTLALIALPAAAQSLTTAALVGTAEIGPETRQVGINFSCSLSRSKNVIYTAELDVPDAEQLKRVFDVDPFEGPTGIEGRMHLVATGSGTARVDLGSSGSFGNNGLPGTTFTFSARATPESRFKASQQKLQAVLAILSSGPGEFTWQAENPVKGGQPIKATAYLSNADAVRLRGLVAACRSK